MTFFGKKVTEQQAAAEFVLLFSRQAEEVWPSIFKNLKDLYGEKFEVEDERLAVFDLFLAAVTLELQAVRNLFSQEQGERIYQWIIRNIDTPEYGDYAKEEINRYERAFQDGVKNAENPVDGIAARLLHRWLGKGVSNFEVEIGDKKTGFISPLLVMQVVVVLSNFPGVWKRIKQDFKLVDGRE